MTTRTRRKNTVTTFISDILDSTKDFADDVLDRGRDLEDDVRRSARNTVESRNETPEVSRADIADFQKAISALTKKVDALAKA